MLTYVNTFKHENGLGLINELKDMLCLIDSNLIDVTDYYPNIKDAIEINTCMICPVPPGYLFKFLFQHKDIKDIDMLANLVNLAIKRDYYKFMITVCKSENEYLNRSINNLNLYHHKDVNLLKSSLFLVQDLSFFIKSINAFGYKCNAGSQKQRGQVNYSNHILTLLDIQFRTSLYKHYCYHCERNASVNLNVNVNNFSYDNIHKNIGGVT